MSDAAQRTRNASFDVRPHAYDPAFDPEFFEGVLTRRVFALIIDAFILAMPVMLAVLVIFVFGVVTLGLGWMLYWLLPAGAALWGVLYYGLCFGSAASATVGMRVMNIEMRTWYGGPAYFLLGAVHAVAYWISVSALTPFILLVALFNSRGRLLHDILLGTIVVNNAARAASLRAVPVRR